MNKFVPIFLLFLINSCYLPKPVYDTELKTEVFIFENKDFTFKYPKNWDSYKDPLVEDVPVIYLAPYQEIEDMTLKYDNKSKIGSYSNDYFCVYKDRIYTSFKSYIDEKIEKLVATNNIYKFLKKNENHYILLYDTNTNNSEKVIKQYFKIHYYFLNQNVYSIMFINTADTYYKYEKDQYVIEKSFIFKTPEGERLLN